MRGRCCTCHTHRLQVWSGCPVIGRPERIVLKRDPDCETETDGMEFRLTYEGILLGASKNNTRARHKHEIRKIFHRQLRRLWEEHPAFEVYHYHETDGHPLNKLNVGGALPKYSDYVNARTKELYQNMLQQFERCGYKFFPLATRKLSLRCAVHILFLRPDLPGGAIRSGDIDNRMKTVFDALRLPTSKEELDGYETPEEGEEPFFCLLEDDSLIGHAAIETDTLLQPTSGEWQVNDARLIITVRLWPYRTTFDNLVFGV
jgi:hypothetical protein